MDFRTTCGKFFTSEDFEVVINFSQETSTYSSTLTINCIYPFLMLMIFADCYTM